MRKRKQQEGVGRELGSPMHEAPDAECGTPIFLAPTVKQTGSIHFLDANPGRALPTTASAGEGLSCEP